MRHYDEDNTVRYRMRSMNLCLDCFTGKNQESARRTLTLVGARFPATIARVGYRLNGSTQEIGLEGAWEACPEGTAFVWTVDYFLTFEKTLRN